MERTILLLIFISILTSTFAYDDGNMSYSTLEYNNGEINYTLDNTSVVAQGISEVDLTGVGIYGKQFEGNILATGSL